MPLKCSAYCEDISVIFPVFSSEKSLQCLIARSKRYGFLAIACVIYCYDLCLCLEGWVSYCLVNKTKWEVTLRWSNRSCSSAVIHKSMSPFPKWRDILPPSRVKEEIEFFNMTLSFQIKGGVEDFFLLKVNLKPPHHYLQSATTPNLAPTSQDEVPHCWCKTADDIVVSHRQWVGIGHLPLILTLYWQLVMRLQGASNST